MQRQSNMKTIELLCPDCEGAGMCAEFNSRRPVQNQHINVCPTCNGHGVVIEANNEKGYTSYNMTPEVQRCVYKNSLHN